MAALYGAFRDDAAPSPLALINRIGPDTCEPSGAF
jgi:hypothetical protein